ncbi:MAG: beta,4-mannosyltransferase [Pseudonocardiales bacterium]|nr:beta,4-mannosyltransferase [Pseudonocardiales bacterium]
MLRGANPVKSWLRRLAFASLLLRLRLGRRALVRTMHNLHPHEQGPRTERWLIGLSERWTTLWIRLNDGEHRPGNVPMVTIAHGDYRDWYAGFEVPESCRGTLLYFGLVRTYKGVDQLLSAFADCADQSLTLRIMGKADAGPLRDAIEAAQTEDGRITAQLNHLSDAEVAREVGRAELVVLPYRDMFNSGTLVLALSLGRPVLVPSGEVTSALADEVGADWIIRYSGALTPEVLINALVTIRRQEPGRAPDLSRRTWDRVGAQHVSAYRTAASLMGCGVSEV